VSHPIRIANRILGQVELGLDTSALALVMEDARKWMLTVAGLEILLVALFGFALGTLLTRQLTALQESTHRVAGGDFGYTLDVRGKDELASTAVSFNQMSRALADFAQDLEQARQKAEAKRALAESVLEDAVNSVAEGIAIVDAHGKLKHINLAFSALLPCDHNNSPPSNNKFHCCGDETPILKELNTLLQSGQADEGEAQWTVKQPDGRCILNSRSPLQSGGWVFVKTDVTPIYKAQERERELERELLQAHKLEALGTMAGGIAHEINTPIHYIGDNLRFFSRAAETLLNIIAVHNALLTKVDAANLFPEEVKTCRNCQDDSDLEFLSEEILDAAEQSLDGVERVATIVLAMKEFSHPTCKAKTQVDLNRIIERTKTVCQNEWKHVAEVVLNLDPDLPPIMANEGELNQVMLNLIVNAAQAIAESKGQNKDPGKGTITVRTRTNNATIRVEVEDTGPGVPAHLCERIFEPFFTTKAVGKGSGQGLALCRDMIVNKHMGRFWLKSPETGGAVFIFTLPISG
jgi:signal transduction histidine kinase